MLLAVAWSAQKTLLCPTCLFYLQKMFNKLKIPSASFGNFMPANPTMSVWQCDNCCKSSWERACHGRKSYLKGKYHCMMPGWGQEVGIDFGLYAGNHRFAFRKCWLKVDMHSKQLVYKCFIQQIARGMPVVQYSHQLYSSISAIVSLQIFVQHSCQLLLPSQI